MFPWISSIFIFRFLRILLRAAVKSSGEQRQISEQKTE